MDMKRITICGPDKIIEDIKETAWKLRMSVSRYMINLHAMQQAEKYPDAVRGSNVARETFTPGREALKTAEERHSTRKPKKTIPEAFKELESAAGVQSMTGFSGPQPKAQTGKK